MKIDCYYLVVYIVFIAVVLISALAFLKWKLCSVI